MMDQGTLAVQHDGTLTIEPQIPEDAATVEVAVAPFAERLSPVGTQASYRLTAASIWQARRAGYILADILQTLETYSSTEIPANVRADIERWSQQIDRLSLEVTHGRLLLHSTNPLAITAVMHHRTLKAFVARQVDATTVELDAAAYPALLQTFDACRYPMMDRVPPGWKPDEVPAPPAVRQAQPTTPRSIQPVPPGRWAEVVAELPRLPRQCQATTRTGRQCKNRARPGVRFCQVHTDRPLQAVSLETFTLQAHLASAILEDMLETSLLTLPQLAVARMAMLMGLGLVTWLLSWLLMGLGMGRGFLALPPWAVTGLALGLTCGLAGYLLARLRLLASLRLLLTLVTSIGLDCLHKEGLILNICFVVIPVLLPMVLLTSVGLSLGWVFPVFPVGVAVGRLFYAVLEASSG